MEQGFDISQFKWLILLIVFVLYKFFGAKPKGQSESMPQELEGEEEPRRNFDELLGELFDLPPKAEAEQKVKPKREKRVAQAKSAAPKQKAATRKIEDNLASDSAENSDENQEEFDLEKAVIMSEILTRKYDE